MSIFCCSIMQNGIRPCTSNAIGYSTRSEVLQCLAGQKVVVAYMTHNDH